jgi:TonB family protein
VEKLITGTLSAHLFLICNILRFIQFLGKDYKKVISFGGIMNDTAKIFFITFTLMFLTIGCSSSKEEIQTITVGGSCHPKNDRKLREPIIVVEFISLTEDTSFYELPKIVSGIVALQSKIKYPDYARRSMIEGKVYVSVDLDSLGKIENCKLIKGINPECDSAAIEEIKKQIFVPAKRKGVPIRDTFSIMVLFRLQ